MVRVWAFLLCLVAAQAAADDRKRVVFVHMVSSDTLRVMVGVEPGMMELRDLTLAGVAMPQDRDAQCSDEQAKGINAISSLAETLHGAASIEVNPIHDSAGRMAGFVYVNGQDLAAGLIEAGLGISPKDPPPWCN